MASTAMTSTQKKQELALPPLEAPELVVVVADKDAALLGVVLIQCLAWVVKPPLKVW